VPTVPATSNGNFVGSRNVTVALSATGPIPHYGRGNAERSAPAGQRLLAFELILSGGEINPITVANLDLGVSVDGGAVHRLPIPANVAVSGQDFVAAIPRTATSVDLVVVDAGITQRMSLLTGKPGPDNLAVLQRTDRIDGALDYAHAVATVDSNVRFTAHLDVSFSSARLGYFTPYSLHASGPSKALVYVDICYSSQDFDDPTACHSFRGTDLTLKPKGGKAIVGRNASPNDDDYVVFEVPASFSEGTLTVTGSEHTSGFSMDVTTPCHFTIRFEPSDYDGPQ
jgi:hypothetical protein